MFSKVPLVDGKTFFEYLIFESVYDIFPNKFCGTL